MVGVHHQISILPPFTCRPLSPDEVWSSAGYIAVSSTFQRPAIILHPYFAAIPRPALDDGSSNSDVGGEPVDDRSAYHTRELDS
jgi:hypothetical protein